jgi:hypothetical protein
LPFHDLEAQASLATLAEGRGGCRGPFLTRPMSQMALCCSVDCDDCDRTTRRQSGSKAGIAQHDVKNQLQSRTDGDGGCIVAWSGCPFHRAMIGGQWAEI